MDASLKNLLAELGLSHLERLLLADGYNLISERLASAFAPPAYPEDILDNHPDIKAGVEKVRERARQILNKEAEAPSSTVEEQDMKTTVLNLAKSNSRHYKLLPSEEMKDKKPLYMEAIQADPSFAMAYVGLARCLRGAETVELPDQPALDKAGLARKAIELDAECTAAYSTLATTMSEAERDGTFRDALTRNPNCPYALCDWATLLENYGSIVVTLPDQTEISKRDLLLRAIRADPKFAVAYVQLSDMLNSGTVALEEGGFEYNELRLLRLAVLLDPCSDEALFTLACKARNTAKLLVKDGLELSESELYREALKCNPDHQRAKSYLSKTMKNGDVFTLPNGQTVTRAYALIEDAWIGIPSKMAALSDLVTALEKDDTVTWPNGNVQTKFEILAEMLTMEPDSPWAAYGVGNAMRAGDTIEYKGKVMNDKEMLAEAVTMGMKTKEACAWMAAEELARHLAPGEKVKVNGRMWDTAKLESYVADEKKKMNQSGCSVM